MKEVIPATDSPRSLTGTTSAILWEAFGISEFSIKGFQIRYVKRNSDSSRYVPSDCS
jgi:hypothetical protein